MSNTFDWRDVVRADLDALPTRSEPTRAARRPVSVALADPVESLLKQQAEKRGISRASYAKRATMALLALDLGIRLADLTRMDPRLVRETGYTIEDPEGAAFGPWELEGFAGE